MGSIYYHTVDGRILGESGTNGSRRYVTDALGSVAATVKNGAIENTYRYKPYGQTLAKTGAAEDPRFLWTGEVGSRNDGTRDTEQYNRNRHYGPSHATWTAKDALWPRFHPFGYVEGNPTTLQDPIGLYSLPRGYPAGWRTVNIGSIGLGGTFNSKCGAASWQIFWMLVAPMYPDTSGYIIQHVRGSRRCFTCNGPACGSGPPNGNYNHDQYEAFRVEFFPSKGDYQAHGDVDDTWQLGGDVPCSTGFVRISSNMRYYPGLTDSDLRLLGFTRGGCSSANFMFCTTFKPHGWVDRPPTRSMEYEWNCCGHPPKCDNNCTPLSNSFTYTPEHYP